ncbi:MAG: GTPase HflX [Pseudomonadota bacterium]
MNNSLIDRRPPVERAGISIPWFSPIDRPTEARVEETSGLAEALGCELSFVTTEQVRKASPSHLLTGGVLNRIKEDLEAAEASLFVLDGALTPVQQRNLEKRLGVKVIDRTGLILEIFGLRARTKAGQLQVELARQLYERSRLVRTWTHLERQRGGNGFLSGPGETQLEADKRMLDTKIRRLREDLEDVRRTRYQQRRSRIRSGIPVVALVGYTNAGKSTLFNRLSGADVLAKDMPFATLDPTTRRVSLPDIGDIALTDTVGFISDLPTHLIESFQATLEEAMEADVLIHVRDRSSPVDGSQKADVERVLDQLQAGFGQELPPMIEVWNKSDQLAPDHIARLRAQTRDAREMPSVVVSALTGDGIDELIETIQTHLRRASHDIEVQLRPEDGAARAWLYANGEVQQESVCEQLGTATLNIRLPADRRGQFEASFPDVAERERQN